MLLKTAKILFSKAKKFILEDIWRIKLNSKSKYFRFAIIQLRIVIISIKGVMEDRMQLRASALSFYSIMSIVPIFAIMFGIAKLLGSENHLNNFIASTFEGQDMIINPVMRVTNSLLDQAKGQFMTGFGSIVLILAINKLIQNIELSFNDIWHITQKRKFSNKVFILILTIIIAPILIIISSTATIFLNNNVNNYAQNIEIFTPIMDIITTILSFSNYAVMWLFFTLLYFILPNIKVRPKAAIYAGIICGTMFNLLQWGYITFQIGVTNLSIIYGSFAAVPLFLTWMQLSWFVVLIGSKIAFAIQNYDSKEGLS